MKKDLTELELIPLYNVFRKALKEENYEQCAEIKKEIEHRRISKTLCPFALIMLKRSSYSLYGLFD